MAKVSGHRSGSAGKPVQSPNIPQICFDLFRGEPTLFMRSPARIHWRIHESIHSGVRVGIHAGLHENTHGGIHDSVHESIHGGVHESIHKRPPRLLGRMPDVYTKRVLHIHLIPQGCAPRPVRHVSRNTGKKVTVE
jgi:hypothetical protein